MWHFSLHRLQTTKSGLSSITHFTVCFFHNSNSPGTALANCACPKASLRCYLSWPTRVATTNLLSVAPLCHGRILPFVPDVAVTRLVPATAPALGQQCLSPPDFAKRTHPLPCDPPTTVCSVRTRARTRPLHLRVWLCARCPESRVVQNRMHLFYPAF